MCFIFEIPPVGGVLSGLPDVHEVVITACWVDKEAKSGISSEVPKNDLPAVERDA